MLDQARLIWQGQSIYKGLDGYPYAFSNYPPLLQTLAALLIPLLGVSYATGRVWNVVSIVALAALIYHVVRVRGGDRRAAALGALAFVGSPYIYHWAPLFRVDLPGLLLSALGIAVAGRLWQDRAPGPGRRSWPGCSLWPASIPSTASSPRPRRPSSTCWCATAGPRWR